MGGLLYFNAVNITSSYISLQSLLYHAAINIITARIREPIVF